MDLIYQLFQNNLDVVFFVYGLAFVAMGIAILVQPRKESKFKFAGILWVLAGFGLTHGINEWLDMWTIIKGKHPTLDLVRWSCLIISYIFFFEFGRNLLRLGINSLDRPSWWKKIIKPKVWWLSLTIGFYILFAGLISPDFWTAGSIWARYLLGFPGGVLTGLGFFSYYENEKKALTVIEPLKVKKYFRGAGLSLFVYSILGGLIVPKGNFFPSNWLNNESFFLTVHIPIQVFRAFCAIVAAYNITRILGIFDWETKMSLQRARDELEVRVVERTAELKLANEQLQREITERKQTEKDLQESERRYKSLVESVTDYIYTVDVEDGRSAATRHGHGCIAVTGYRSEEYKADPYLWYRMIHEKDRDAVIEEANKILSGEAVPIEHRIVHKDGSIRWVRNTPVPYFDESGHLISYDGLVTDITERKKAEDALRETSQTLQLLIDSSPLAIIAVDPEGNIILWNPAAERIFGWKAYEVLGNPNPIIPPDKKEEFLTLRGKTLRGELLTGLELRRQRKDGTLIDINLSTAPLRNAKGSVIGVVVLIGDITERKKIEDEVYRIKQDWEFTFNSIIDMVTVHDKDWNIILANKAAEKILKLPILEKAPETKCFRYYHGTEGPPPGCPSCDCLKTGVPANFELFEPHLNMFIEIRAIPRFDSNNNLIGLIHVVRDITERKKAEEDLSKLLHDIIKAKKEWETTFDNATELIMLVDKELNIIRCNKSFADFAGKSINEVLGHKCYEFLLCEDEQIKWCRERITADNPTEWIEVKIGSHWLYVSHRPVIDEKGEFMHSVIIATDFTYVKDAQEEISKSEEELKKRVADLERFYDMAVGRELKMKELKKEIKRLNEELSRYRKE